MKEGKTRQRVDGEKQREGEEWRMRCRVSGERQRNGELGKETVVSMCCRVCVFFQGRVSFPETLEEKHLGGEIFSR